MFLIFCKFCNVKFQGIWNGDDLSVRDHVARNLRRDDEHHYFNIQVSLFALISALDKMQPVVRQEKRCSFIPVAVFQFLNVSLNTADWTGTDQRMSKSTQISPLKPISTLMMHSLMSKGVRGVTSTATQRTLWIFSQKFMGKNYIYRWPTVMVHFSG